MRSLGIPASRSGFCTNSLLLVLGSVVCPTPTQPLSFSVSDSLQIIWKYCPTEFRQAVRESGGRFLYRGESPDMTCPTILNPKPDLLLPTTYNDPQALSYFEWLERETATPARSASTSRSRRIVRPSTAHIGTANEENARVWGAPVSVWPLGDSFAYLWPRNRDCLYPGGSTSSTDDLVIQKDLDLALRTGKEVLFSTSAADLRLHGPAFLACPKAMESDLRRQLRESNYGLFE